MTNKISMDKTYRTRDGRDVKIYTTEHEGPFPVVGSVGDDVYVWRANGWFYANETTSNLDLIEVKPEKVVWVVCEGVGAPSWVANDKEHARAYVYEHGGTIHRVTLNEDNEVK